MRNRAGHHTFDQTLAGACPSNEVHKKGVVYPSADLLKSESQDKQPLSVNTCKRYRVTWFAFFTSIYFLIQRGN